jgi:hypothetical protein
LIATIGKVKEDILESGQLWENSERSLDRFLHEQLNPVGGEPLQATAVPSGASLAHSLAFGVSNRKLTLGDMSEFGIEGEEGLDESSPSALLPREALERLVAENIENVYEVMKGDIEPAEGSSGKKMSREERIAQRKAKRAAAAATAPVRLDFFHSIFHMGAHAFLSGKKIYKRGLFTRWGTYVRGKNLSPPLDLSF